MSLFNELKRRNVFRVGIAYAISAWVILQVADVIGEIMELPEWGGKLILLMLIVGFVPALIFAWAFELTPEGLKREKDVDRSTSITTNTGRKLDRAIMLVMAVALAWFAWDKFSQQQPEIGSGTFSETANVPKPEETPDPTNSARGDKSIAVLPFVNMSNDPEQEYFSDGLAEELLNRLAKISELRVAARTSAFQFKGQNLDIAEIGRQLKVDNVLEGSVRKAGNRVRITAQLISAEDGYHLWSETYERELNDIFAIQDDISGAITRALEVELGMGVAETTAGDQHDLEAYNLYLQARYLLARRGGDNMLQAVERFEQAVALEPEFAEAWAGMAFTASILPNYTSTVSGQAAVEMCLRAARRALELDPNNAEALVARGRVRAAYIWEWAGAKSDFESALAAAPNDIQALNLYGDFLAQTGAFEQAEAIKKRLAFELDPLSAVHSNDLHIQYLMRGMYAESLEFAQQTISLDPGSAMRREALIWAYAGVGEYAEARKVMDELQGAPGLIAGAELLWPVWLAYQEGDIPALRQSLNALIAFEEASELSYWSTNIAFMLLWLDGAEAALPWLDKAYQGREFGLVWPDNFYLPEINSKDSDWLAFWQRPGLAELIAMRRANGQTDITIGWKPRPATP